MTEEHFDAPQAKRDEKEPRLDDAQAFAGDGRPASEDAVGQKEGAAAQESGGEALSARPQGASEAPPSRGDSAVAAALTVGGEKDSLAAARKRTRASRVVAWCVAACAAVAIAVCGWTLASSTSVDGAGAGQTADAPAAQETAAGASEETAASEGDDRATHDAGKQDEASEPADSAADAPAASNDADAMASQHASASSGEGDASRGSASSDSNADSGSAGGASSSAGSSNASGQSAPSGQTSPSVPSNIVTVSVQIDSSAAGSPVSLSTTVSFEKGATAYDALVGTGVAVGSEQSVYGIYVTSIGGLAADKDSGWTYYVNGAFINDSCGDYVLSDGDTVLWKYVDVR